MKWKLETELKTEMETQPLSSLIPRPSPSSFLLLYSLQKQGGWPGYMDIVIGRQKGRWCLMKILEALLIVSCPRTRDCNI